MIWKLLIFNIIFSLSSIGAESTKKSRVDELLLWKVAEESKLKVNEEQQLDRLLTQLREKKQGIQSIIDNALSNLEKAKDEKTIKKWISEYREGVKKMNELNVEEIDRISKTFGSHLVRQYLLVKAELSEKIKSLLSGHAPLPVPESNQPKSLPEPRVIEE